MKVSELFFKIRNLIELQLEFRDIWVEGEISDVRIYHSSNSIYFTIKDEQVDCNLSCYVGKNFFYKIINKIEWTKGNKIKIFGYVSVWQSRSQITFHVQDAEKQDGLGEKFIQLEKLKQKLKTEGLFDISHKKKIPLYPKKIGIITSLQGAAIHDIYKTMKKRYSNIHIIIFPALVQGEEAPKSLIQALKEADNYEKYQLDLLILTRGGGSTEDLWCFNDEQLARTIFALKTPIISAIGHEIDVTISDLVADLRAATPTQAVDSLPSFSDELDKIVTLKEQIFNLINHKITNAQTELLSMKEWFPMKMKHDLGAAKNTISNLKTEVMHAIQIPIKSYKQQIQNFEKEFNISQFYKQLNHEKKYLHDVQKSIETSLKSILNNLIQNIDKQKLNIVNFIQNITQKEKNELQILKQNVIQAIQKVLVYENSNLKNLQTEIQNLDYQKILEKGFSITTDAHGKLIRSVEELQQQAQITTIVKDGQIISKITEIHKNNSFKL